jgi:hypothetical protein
LIFIFRFVALQKNHDLKFSKKKYFSSGILFVLFFLCQNSRAQFYNFPNEYFSALITEKVLAVKDSSIHSGIKPYVHFFSDKYRNVSDTHRIFKYISKDAALDIAFFKHVIAIQPNHGKYKFTLDPIFNIETGNDYYNHSKKITSTNTRGYIAAGYVGEKVYFETMFVESQAQFPAYYGEVVKAAGVVPGQGRWKTFKKTGYDYAFSSGFISIQPKKNLNIQLGHGKQKIGHGYRSLLLSDNSFNYPYTRITQQLFGGRVQYNAIYAVLMNLVPSAKKTSPYAERLFQKKAASFQYLSINATKGINIGFFQGLVWQPGDDKNRQHLAWQYFNPLIYSNIPQLGLNDKHNILVGTDLKIKLNNKINFYSQLMLDDLSNSNSLGKAFGYQAGVNLFDLLNIRNLFFQVEYNQVSEASYRNAGSNLLASSYSHYNQTLAYVPGYGQEMLLIGDYKFRRIFLNMKYHYQIKPSDGDYYFQTHIFNGKLGFLINPSYNLNIALGYTYRNQNFPNFKNLSNQTNYIYLALRTSLYNLYSDF